MPYSTRDETKRKLKVIQTRSVKIRDLAMKVKDLAEMQEKDEIVNELLEVTALAATIYAKAEHCIKLIDGRAL